MPPQENLIVNPGFEENIAWEFYATDPTGGSSAFYDTALFHSGLRSAALRVLADGRGSISQDIRAVLTEGGTYRLRCWYISDAPIIIYVVLVDATGAWISFYRLFLPSVSTWTQTNWLQFTLPTGAEWQNVARVTTFIDVSGPASVNVDDFEMYSLAATHTVTIDSTPIVGIPVTVDGGAVGNTPITVTVEEGSHTFTVPSEVTA